MSGGGLLYARSQSSRSSDAERGEVKRRPGHREAVRLGERGHRRVDREYVAADALESARRHPINEQCKQARS